MAAWAASRWGLPSEDTGGRRYHPWPPGRLAQLVERLPYTQVAGGSNPSPPIRERAARPEGVGVLNEHLDKGGPDAWRAALRIFEHQYGRAPEQPEERSMPTTVEEVEKLSWSQLVFLRVSPPTGWATAVLLGALLVGTHPLAAAFQGGPWLRVATSSPALSPRIWHARTTAAS